ncbi:MAG: Cu(I)-responsive transcriptional regulator [Caulobacter sp.]|nr:Cu(I)-responsive transcriptional regulator [Caulobacter sp.]
MLRPLRAPGRGVLVSEAGRLCNLTPRAIRFYEEEGLIRSTRGPAGQRLFDDAMLDRLIYIAEARSLGLTVRDVQELLEIGDTQGPEPQRARLLEGCARRLSEIEDQQRLVQSAIHGLNRKPASSRLRMAG